MTKIRTSKIKLRTAIEKKETRKKTAEEIKAEREDMIAELRRWQEKRALQAAKEEAIKVANRGKAPAWLLTFSDIMALMLTFFVLLYSMSTPELEKWEDFTEALTVGFSKFKSPKAFQGQQQEINIERLDFKNALNLDYLESLIHDSIIKDDALADVKLFNQGDRLILSLPVDLLFQTGKTDVNTEGRRALFDLGAPLSRIRNRIEVIGHADPQPITGGAFASNWELSLARAVEVSAILYEVGYTRDILVRGMSSARFDELPRSLSRTERADFARRVDIVIMRDDGTLRFSLD